MHKRFQQYELHVLFWLIYVFWIVLFVNSWIYGFIDKLGLIIVVGFILSVIIHIFVSGLEIKPSKKTSTDLDAVNLDIKGHKLHKIYYYLIINRVYVFPALLVLYLVYLLIKQTHLRNLNNALFFALIDETLLMTLVIVSGIATIFREIKDKKYQKELLSKKSTYITLWLSIVLSVLGWYIIYLQTNVIGAISVPISSIAGVLIFLIGVLILEDEETAWSLKPKA